MKDMLALVFGIFFLLLLQAVTPASAQTFVNLHTFAASDANTGTNADGSAPWDSLVLSGNTLYGTAQEGGYFNSGAIFAVNTDGSGFTNLYSFTGDNDGGGPYDQLLLSSNTLYGTADYGGTSGWGVIFKINTDGSGFTNIYSFPSGNYSDTGLILQSNILYGVARHGGTSGFGTVFAVNTDGSSFTNLHNFTGIDGSNPLGSLVLSSNVLYGTTVSGGSYSWGTVFAVNTDGTGFTNLYSFIGGTDGGFPQDSLVLSGNALYGITSGGGDVSRGVVFAVHTDGTGFTNLYSFTGGTDGADPYAGLILSGNTLYGTAVDGGSGGNGSIFSINTDGTGFTSYYNFTAVNPDGNFNSTNSDGANPFGGLVLSGNTLYGTANIGGLSGNGTVFALNLTSLPRLNINPSGTNLLVSWPSSTDTNFVLQQNLDLTTTNWTTSNLSISDDGTNKSAVVIPASGSDFFRLAKTNSP